MTQATANAVLPDLGRVPRCEIRHTVGDPCTVVAVAVLRGCDGSALICAQAVREISGHPVDRTCNVCDRPFGVCWAIVAF